MNKRTVWKKWGTSPSMLKYQTQMASSPVNRYWAWLAWGFLPAFCFWTLRLCICAIWCYWWSGLIFRNLWPTASLRPTKEPGKGKEEEISAWIKGVGKRPRTSPRSQLKLNLHFPIALWKYNKQHMWLVNGENSWRTSYEKLVHV